MNNFILVASVLGVAVILLFLSLWVHAFIARIFGAESGTKSRVLMAGILSSIALFVAVLILSNTLLPELGNQFTGTTTDENATTSSTLYKVVVYTGPLVVFLVSSLIFALCVRLGFIKSFITLLVGALATTLITTVAVFGLSQAGINQQKLNMAFQQAEQIEAVVTTGSNALSFDSEDNNKIHTYRGSHQSKRIAIQQMAQNVCGCSNESQCVLETFETYRMFANRHKKSYPADETGFLDELDKKVSFCAGEINPELSAEVPATTHAELETAIRNYHDQLGKWAGTYKIEDIIKQENRRHKDGSYTAHVRYKFTPTKESNRKSDGLENRTFDYRKNEDGSFSVYAMGAQDSARFIKPESLARAKWHPVSVNVLNNYDGVKLRVTRIVGEVLEGNLIGLTNNHIIVYTRRRDGEVGYEIERDTISSIEAWY